MIDVERRKKRQKKYYAKKRKEQRCVTCGKQDERTLDGYAYCASCNAKRYHKYDPSKRSNERRNRENADKREWAKMLRDNCLCLKCRRKDSRTINGKGLCLWCATRTNAELRERRKTNGDKLREQAKTRRLNWVSDGLCSNCGHEKEEPQYKMCCSCRLRAKLNRQRRSRENGNMKPPRGVQGRCWQCNNAPAMEGKRLCTDCYAKKIKTITASGFIKEVKHGTQS